MAKSCCFSTAPSCRQKGAAPGAAITGLQYLAVVQGLSGWRSSLMDSLSHAGQSGRNWSKMKKEVKARKANPTHQYWRTSPVNSCVSQLPWSTLYFQPPWIQSYSYSQWCRWEWGMQSDVWLLFLKTWSINTNCNSAFWRKLALQVSKACLEPLWGEHAESFF